MSLPAVVPPPNARLRDGIPVHPGGWPVLGHLPRIFGDLPGVLRDAERSLGPLFWLEMGFGKTFLVCLAPASFELFKNKQTSSATLAEIAGQLLGRNSLIVHDGPPHRHMRSALNPPFTPRGLSVAEVANTFA